jgi:hypothetical protein
MNKLLLIFFSFFIGIFLYLLLKNSCKCKVVEGQNKGDIVTWQDPNDRGQGKLWKILDINFSGGSDVAGAASPLATATIEEFDPTGTRHAGAQYHDIRLGNLTPLADAPVPPDTPVPETVVPRWSPILPGENVPGTVDIIITRELLNSGSNLGLMKHAAEDPDLLKQMAYAPEGLSLNLRILRLPILSTIPGYIIWQLSDDGLEQDVYQFLVYDGDERLMFAEWDGSGNQAQALLIFTVEWPDEEHPNIRVGNQSISLLNSGLAGIDFTRDEDHLNRGLARMGNLEFNIRWLAMYRARGERGMAALRPGTPITCDNLDIERMLAVLLSTRLFSINGGRKI